MVLKNTTFLEQTRMNISKLEILYQKETQVGVLAKWSAISNQKTPKNIMFGSKRGVKGDQNFLYQPFDIEKLGLFQTVQEPGGVYPD